MPRPMASATAKFADDFKAKMGAVPGVRPGPHRARHLGARRGAEEAEAEADDKLNVKQLAFAMETVSFRHRMGEVAMREEDHQVLLPLVVATVSKDAKYKVDGTDMGFKPVQLITGKEAASPVQASCKMERPG